MRSGGKATIALMAAGMLAASFAASTPAQAGNFFEDLFGGLRQTLERAEPPGEARSFAPSEPFPFLRGNTERTRGESGPSKAFCVRTCDGHFFPVQAQRGMSVTQACHAFCPGSDTKIYSGSNIDYATGSDGSRYEDLPNAFLYRKQLVAGCTCNGHDPFGLARVDVNTDTTLRPGDVVATTNGMAVFSGANDKTAGFTPVQDYTRFPKSYRDQLAAMRISHSSATPAYTSSVAPAAADQRNAQLER